MKKKTTKDNLMKGKKRTANAMKTYTMPTLLQAIEKIVELARDSQLSDEFLLKAAPEIGLISDSYGITEMQAVLFSICLAKGPRRVDFDDLASFLDLSNIRMLGYAGDIDVLVRKRMLRYRDAKDEDMFDVYQPVIRALKHNEVYEMPKMTGLDCAELFEQMDMLFDDLDNDAVSPDELYLQLKQLFDDNIQVGFVKKVKEMYLEPDEFLLLLLFSHLLVNKDDDDIRFGQMEYIFSSKADFNNAKKELRAGTHELMMQKMVEHRCEDGVADTARYRLTDYAKRNLLEEMKVSTAEDKIADVIKPEELVDKELFYSAAIGKQVDELACFLMPEQFRLIQERMRMRGFRNGFACLFYGGPGTGKTETAYQLARKTGRHIMVVDVPQIKSKWVGDSEKNIKALFGRYREQVKRYENAPILLFNEADAIIGVRKAGASSAVDKMENSIQNIILQEMETLDGIMIATTNLEQNLDPAFERRFLYKIKFEKPDASVRQKIWMEMIPELDAADAMTLASSYDLSGGQIENVARKHSINVVLHGEQDNVLPSLQDYCSAEKLNQERQVTRIGFCA